MWFKSLDLSDEGKRSSRILPNNPLVCFLDAVYRTKLSRSSCSSKIVSLPEDRYLYKMTSKQWKCCRWFCCWTAIWISAARSSAPADYSSMTHISMMRWNVGHGNLLLPLTHMPQSSMNEHVLLREVLYVGGVWHTLGFSNSQIWMW